MFSSKRRMTFTRRPFGLARFSRSAFTLVEVMAASCVLMVGLGGTVLTVKSSLASISHARHLGAASQIMQSELERLRLRSWEQLQAIQDAGDNTVSIDNLPAGSNLTCSRQIRDLRDGLKEITVEARWGGNAEKAHTARLVTRYARNGLNDYFYTSH
jgi:Tfp pilus assembly protein PilV